MSMSNGAEAYVYSSSVQEYQRPKLRVVDQHYEAPAEVPREIGAISDIKHYDVMFDVKAFEGLEFLRRTNTLAYEKKRSDVEGHIGFNIKTALAERLKAPLSRRRIDIIEGQLCDTNTKVPLLQMIQNGIDWHEKNGVTPSDHVRELAEKEGYIKINDLLGNRFTPVGTMMVSFSPPGENPDSLYKDNYIDITEVKADETGKKYVESTRLSSGLSLTEYKEKVQELRPDYFENKEEEGSFTDVDFLANPFEVRSIPNVATLEKFLYKDHTYMDYDQFQEIVRLCEPFIQAYLVQLAKNPHDDRARNVRFNAILNKADELAKQFEAHVIVRDVFVKATDTEIERLGTQEVREVDTACGPSGGAKLGEDPVYSAATLGESDDRGSLYFKCPNEKFCGKINKRKPNERRTHCEFCNTNVAC
jgi:hypothetical protein